MTRSRRRARNLAHRAAIARGWMFKIDTFKHGLPSGRVVGRRGTYRYGMALVYVAHPWSRSRRKPSQERYIARIRTAFLRLSPEEQKRQSGDVWPVKACMRRHNKMLRQAETQYAESGL